MAGTWTTRIDTGPTRRDERRETIVEAALALFAEHGALPVRVADIAVEAGISRATFYKHFAERDEILAELLSRLLATPPPAPDVDRPACERISMLLAGTAARMADHGQLARIVYTLPVRHDAVLDEEVALPAFVAALEALVTEAMATGQLRADLPGDTLTRHLLRAFDQAMRDWAADCDGDTGPHVTRLVDLALDGCRPPTPQTPTPRDAGPPPQR